MKDVVLDTYHRLPPGARSIVASIRGLYLRAWRYGAETDRLVEEALERDHWSLGRWKTWQEERLVFVLNRAATRVPYYRKLWTERRRRGDRASWEYLENWPLLEKETLRQSPLEFVADDCEPKLMFHENTSGTTGKPLDLWWSKRTVRAWFALHEARNRLWNGVSRHDQWAILGGQPVVGAGCSTPPFWVRNVPMRQLYLSANHVSRGSVQSYIDALVHHRVTHLVAYPSAATILAREASCRVKPGETQLRVVLTNAEPLLPWQREIIGQGLACQVRETYGMAEIVAAASECPKGTLHTWPEVGWSEILCDEGDTPSVGPPGRLVCTSLLNQDMPLVRYVVGDRARVDNQPQNCSCDRTLPSISSIEGRNNDLLVATDGRRVYWLNPVFYGLPIVEAQIVQDSLEEVRVRFVAAPAFDSGAVHSITQRLQMRLGNVRVRLERVDKIARGPNGKFRAVICNVPRVRNDS